MDINETLTKINFILYKQQWTHTSLHIKNCIEAILKHKYKRIFPGSQFPY